jgi:hypothetical protein
MNKINRDPLATGPAPCAVANGRGDPIFALFDGGVRSLDNGESSQNYPTRRVTNNVGGVIQGTGIGSIGIGFGTTQGIVTIINSGTISGATGIGLGYRQCVYYQQCYWYPSGNNGKRRWNVRRQLNRHRGSERIRHAPDCTPRQR